MSDEKKTAEDVPREPRVGCKFCHKPVGGNQMSDFCSAECREANYRQPVAPAAALREPRGAQDPLPFGRKPCAFDGCKLLECDPGRHLCKGHGGVSDSANECGETFEDRVCVRVKGHGARIMPSASIHWGPRRLSSGYVEREKHDRLRDALRSIAANGCCDRCQEAALVARHALEENP